MKNHWVVVCSLLFFSVGAFSQSTDASLNGAATDPTGAAVPAAVITVTNVATGIVARTSTNDSGIYSFPALAPGEYRLIAERDGFRKTSVNQIRLDVGARVSQDVQLELGSVTEVVEVAGESETAVGYVTSSLGGMLSEKKILDLPLVSRNSLDFVRQQAGVLGDNFAGSRIGSLNVQMDGVNVMDARINLGVNSTIFPSTDRVAEFRVVTQPVDAEFGRGSGQVQLITRSGTNEFHGSVFNFHRNTVLNANNFFNNLQGRNSAGQPVSPRETLIRNQYGGRIGGPVLKNRTFFHVLYEGQKIRQSETVSATTLTDTARRGLFRYFPGVQNGNANATRPVVDLNGNPVTPSGATGTLQNINLFQYDPNRPGFDPTGNVGRMLELMPSPNNFLVGDGLNTAGYRWNRSRPFNQWQLAIKADHMLNDKHRLSFSYNLERSDELNGFMASPFPNSPGGIVKQTDDLYSATLTSVLSPSLVNEFRAGILRPKFVFNSPWELAGTESMPRSGANPYLIDFLSITDPYNIGNDPQGRLSPNYQYFNKTSWTRGKHNVKFGGQVWFVSTNGYNSFDVMPRSTLGQGGVGYGTLPNVAGIGANLGLAQNLLANYSGSAANVIQALNSPGGADPAFLAGERKNRLWRAPEFGFFFQDDWKAAKNLTLNLGLRYEYYGVPTDRNGRTAGLAGGSAGIFGTSGTDMGALFQPGLAQGSLTNVLLVGPNTTNPGLSLYNQDLNNIAPVLGLSYQLPTGMRYATVLRAGYSVAYERFSLRILDVVSGDQPGLRERVVRTSAQLINQANLGLPLPPNGRPLATVPLTDRTQTVRAYDTGMRTPMVQNWNISIDQDLPFKSILSIRYVASKGSYLLRGADMNEQNITENGLLTAFNQVQTGQTSPLMEQMFRGLNVGGQVVNGTSWTATQALLAATQTRTFFANNNVGGFANYLNSTDNFVGTRGGLLRRASLPENWIVVSPQFASSRLTSNFGSSTYHSMQLEWTKRFSGGWTVQSNYTFAKALGEEEGAGQEQLDSYRTLRNRSLDKRLMSFSVHHVTRTNAIYELPFGKGRKFATGVNKWVDGLIGGWQLGGIFNTFSGDPLAVNSSGALALGTWNNLGDNTAVALQPLNNQLGQAVRTGNGVVYFQGLTQGPDPQIARLSPTIRSLSQMQSITGADGQLLLTNPVPGQMGTLAPRSLYGPGSFRLDMNLIKRIRFTERISGEVNITAENVSNTPQFGNPVTDINDLNFGRITSAGGVRVLVIGARVSF